MTEESNNINNSQPCKRCEYVGEFLSPNPENLVKVCAYKCKGYNALATLPWDKNKPCPLSFNGNFPSP